MRLAFTYLSVTVLASLPLAVQGADRTAILLDTDIGNAAGDAFALAYAAAQERIDLVAVTTCCRGAEDRAWIACRFLTAVGKQAVPVAWGRDPQPGDDVNWQIQYRRHPAAVWNRTSKPLPKPAEDLLYDEIVKRKGELCIVALGPLTNIARLLERHPDARPWIRRIVLPAGAWKEVGGRPAQVEPEGNARTDVEAERAVLRSAVPLEIVPLDATAGLVLPPERLEALFAAHNAVTQELRSLFQLAEDPQPSLYEPAAVALALELPTAVGGKLDRQAFLEGFVKTLAGAGPPRLPGPAWNVQRTVDRRGLPARVHVVEDYETDIEKRWWMTGKLEVEETRAGRRRVCRGVLTQDYDDLQGDPSVRYTAVVFNPVPGPPMGPRTRLSFRYKLHGTSALRVQIYSLSNGYHRALALEGLPQDRWEEATVDMTQARRPDGSGGPLSLDERIDDVQIYADPRADLWVDWLLLYDEAPEGEKRPFPKHVLFTGWFDTGAQGREWPGDFEIVKHDPPRTWKAAGSVIAKETGRPWIRVHLRGERPAGAAVKLRLSCRTEGARSLAVELVHSRTGARAARVLSGLEPGEWTEVETAIEGSPPFVDEIHFRAAEGDGAFSVDDVLLWEADPAGP